MAATPRKPCLTCGRPHSNPGAYCGDHEPSYGYDEAAWRGPGGTRELALERDSRRCLIRADAGCTLTATTVHRLPEYGTDHDTNLDAYVSACAHCHGVIDGRRSSEPRRTLAE